MTLTADDIILLKSQLLPAAGSDLKLYAILDAGVAGDTLLEQFNFVYRVPSLSLLPGDDRYSLKGVSPLLITLTNQPDLLGWLLEQGWRKNWGIYLQTTVELSELYYHLYTLTCVRLPDDRAVYFRYHDPRVLRPFFSVLTPEQGNAFLGPVQRLFVEQEDKIKPRYYERPEGFDEPPPAATPESWTALPAPWWEVNQAQWDAILYQEESLFIDRHLAYLRGIDPELDTDSKAGRVLVERAKTLCCNTEQQYALYLAIGLLHAESYPILGESIDEFIVEAKDPTDRFSRLTEVYDKMSEIEGS